MGALLNLLKETKITRVSNAAVAAQTLVTGDVLDMNGYDGVACIVALGDVDVNSVLTLTAYTDSDVAMGSEVACTTTATFTASATSADNKLLVLDLVRPVKQYVRFKLTRTTGNAVVDSIVAVQYKASKAPVTQGTTVVASGMSVSGS